MLLMPSFIVSGVFRGNFVSKLLVDPEFACGHKTYSHRLKNTPFAG